MTLHILYNRTRTHFFLVDDEQEVNVSDMPEAVGKEWSIIKVTLFETMRELGRNDMYTKPQHMVYYNINTVAFNTEEGVTTFSA